MFKDSFNSLLRRIVLMLYQNRVYLEMQFRIILYFPHNLYIRYLLKTMGTILNWTNQHIKYILIYTLKTLKIAVKSKLEFLEICAFCTSFSR
jgi:hypothetical protein